MRRRRHRWEELRATRDESAHTIELEQRRLAERHRGVEARLQEIRQRIEAAGKLAQQIEVAENDLEAAGKRSEGIRQLREEGTRVRAQAQQTRERLAELDGERDELVQKIAAVGRGELEECPLCGTNLDTDRA